MLRQRVTRVLLDAVRENLRAADVARDRASTQVLRKYDGRHEELLVALRKVHKGRASTPLDPLTRAQMANIVSQQLARTLVDVLQQAPSSITTVAKSAMSAAGKMFFQTTDTKMLKPPEAESSAYHAELEQLSKRAAMATGADVRESVLRKLRSVRLEHDAVSDLIDAASEGYANERWRLQRLIRTEASVAWNGAQTRAFEASEEVFPQMRMRWTELVNDLTGAPLDPRVGKDSLVMHGQVARPGESFFMPADDRAPKMMVGRSWQHPPNRPNDRAVLVPWMPGWGIPAWEYRNGRRRPL